MLSLPVVALLICNFTGTQTNELVGNELNYKRNVSSDLPILNGPFVGREMQVSEIVRHLNSESVDIVSIYGPPAFGKSTLAIYVGYRMIESGVSVRYIDMTESNFLLVGHSTCSWNDMLTHSLTLHNLTSTETAYPYEDWAELLKWAKLIEQHTVLLLDNCDRILHEHREEFHSVLRLIQQHSQNKLRIITTSQEQIKFLDSSYSSSVSELSQNASVRLLQELTRTPEFKVDEVTIAECKELTGLVGNCPLVLKVTAMLLRESSSNASGIAKRLKTALLPTISNAGLPLRQRFTVLMNIAYSFLNKKTRNCSHYLSFFPGSFDLDAAVHVLKLCGVPSGNKCLDILLWRSLIEEHLHGNDMRFKIHKLIKTYFIKNLAYEATNPEVLFNDSFRKHYSKYVSTYAQNIQKTVGSDVEIYKFKSEAHNVHFLLQILLEKPLQTKFEAATLVFAYHEKMLPESHTVYKKIFHALYPRDTFDFVCKVIGMNVCGKVYILVLQNLYLSTCNNKQVECCKVFSCDQLYSISHRIEGLGGTSIGNTSHTANVKQWIDLNYQNSFCKSYYISYQGLLIALKIIIVTVLVFHYLCLTGLGLDFIVVLIIVTILVFYYLCLASFWQDFEDNTSAINAHYATKLAYSIIDIFVLYTNVE